MDHVPKQSPIVLGPKWAKEEQKPAELPRQSTPAPVLVPEKSVHALGNSMAEPEEKRPRKLSEKDFGYIKALADAGKNFKEICEILFAQGIHAARSPGEPLSNSYLNKWMGERGYRLDVTSPAYIKAREERMAHARAVMKEKHLRGEINWPKRGEKKDPPTGTSEAFVAAKEVVQTIIQESKAKIEPITLPPNVMVDMNKLREQAFVAPPPQIETKPPAPPKKTFKLLEKVTEIISSNLSDEMKEEFLRTFMKSQEGHLG